MSNYSNTADSYAKGAYSAPPQEPVVQGVVQGEVVGLPSVNITTAPGLLASQGGLLPDESMNAWRVDFCSCLTNCIKCQPDCCMTYWCICFSLAQIGERLIKLQPSVSQPLTYQIVLIVFFVLWLIGVIVAAVSPGVGSLAGFAYLFLFCCGFVFRMQVRRLSNIPDNCCCDCMGAYFCGPCSTYQMLHQLWKDPARDPGCNFTAVPADLP